MRKSKKILGQKKPSNAAAIWSNRVLVREMDRGRGGDEMEGSPRTY